MFDGKYTELRQKRRINQSINIRKLLLQLGRRAVTVCELIIDIRLT